MQTNQQREGGVMGRGGREDTAYTRINYDLHNAPSRVQEKVLIYLDDVPEGGWVTPSMLPATKSCTTRALIDRGLVKSTDYGRKISLTDMGRIVANGIRHKGAKSILEGLKRIEERMTQ